MLLIAAALVGCTAQQSPGQARVDLLAQANQPSVCFTKADCAAKWARAGAWAQQSGAPILERTDAVLTTGADSEGISYRLVKIALSADSGQISFTATCAGPCGDAATRARSRFSQAVNGG